jgi:C4-type Zn-finger protein
MLNTALCKEQAMKHCPNCGGQDIGTAILARSYKLIRKGAKRLDVCRACGYRAVSVATRDTTKDSDDWQVVDTKQETPGPAKHP